MLLQVAAIAADLAAGVYGVLPEQVPAVKELLRVLDELVRWERWDDGP
jgi:hypothetical protein